MTFGSLLLSFAVLAASTTSRAQGERAWTHRFDGLYQDNDYPGGIVADAQGNAYVAGSTYGPTGFDMTTIKISADGQLLWQDTYDGPGSSHDEAVAAAIDAMGNIYVAGTSAGDDPFARPDIALIKYSAEGDRIWVRRHDSPADVWSYAAGLTLDAAGNPHLVAYTYGSAESFGDYMTFKYDPQGTLLWSRLFSGTGDHADIPRAIAVNPAGDVFVTGGAIFDFAQFYVDMTTVKYDSAGTEMWARTYRLDEAGALDEGYDIVADGEGNVYVAGTGTKSDSSTDWVVVKYDPTGTQAWVRVHDGAFLQSDDVASAIAMTPDGDPVVCGRTIEDSLTYYDFRTTRYTRDGDVVWTSTFDLETSFIDEAMDLVLDASGSVFVLGVTNPPPAGMNYDWALVKYNAAGVQQWVDHFGGPAEFWDFPAQVALDPAGNAYVTGESWAGAFGDYLTIKYEADAACYADCDVSGSLDFFDFLCFQNEFASGSPYADCDDSGALDFFDFLCFQNEFASGCP